MNWGVVAYSLFFIFVAMQRVSTYRLSKKGIGEKTTKLLENRTEMLNRTQEKSLVIALHWGRPEYKVH